MVTTCYVATLVFMCTVSLGIKAQDADAFTIVRCGDVHMTDRTPVFNDDIEIVPPIHEAPQEWSLRRDQWRKTQLTDAQEPWAIPVNDGAQPALGKRFDAVTSTINPPDNAMAIGPRDLIVCAINSRVLIVDTAGTVRFSRGLDGFLMGSVNGPILSRIFCDPRVLFDQKSQRFIVMAMTCEGRSATSQLVFAVSRTDDPLGAWTVYQVRSSFSPPLTTQTWFDFPSIALTDSDIFVTANLFDDAFSYRQAVVVQINKEPLINGSATTPSDIRSYLSLADDPYALFPVAVGNENERTMLAITNGFGNDEANAIRIYEFVGALREGTPSVDVSTVSVPTFQPPGFSAQPGSTVILTCFDQRGAGGVWLDNTLHYVFGVRAPSGSSAVMYLTLRRNGSLWRTVRSQRITRPNSNIAYPSIAAVRSGGRQYVVLTYLYASATDNPGIAVRLIDSSLAVSPELVVRTGDGPVEFQSVDDFGRWADYTSTVSAPDGQSAVWLFAPYGNRNSTWSNLLARIDVAGPSTSVAEPDTRATDHSTAGSVRARSNGDELVVDLVLPSDRSVTIDICDVTGAVLRRLYNGYARAGQSTVHHALNGVAHGAYIVVLRSDDGSACHSLFLR